MTHLFCDTALLRQQQMPNACLQKGERQKEKKKLIKETKKITYSFLATWMTMESHEVPFTCWYKSYHIKGSFI